MKVQKIYNQTAYFKLFVWGENEAGGEEVDKRTEGKIGQGR